MRPFRIVAGACLLAVGLVIPALTSLGCAYEAQNGQTCLKNEDCESLRCLHYVCSEPGTGQTPLPSATTPVTPDSGPPADSAPADAPSGG